MAEQTRHFQALGVTMLVIATGALGFGLFGAEFRVGVDVLPPTTAQLPPLIQFLPLKKLVAAGFALVCYVDLIRSVDRMLVSTEVTGEQVAAGPLNNTYLVVVFVVTVFVVGIFEKHADSQSTAYKTPSAKAANAETASCCSYRLDLVPVRDRDARPQHRGG